MDGGQEAISFLGATMILLLSFLVTVLAVMIVYRKRKLQHAREISTMNEHFSSELLQAQMEVQQQTMQYIGREIHDNVGQKLTLAVLYLRGDAGAKMETVAAIINESLADLRGLSRSLIDVQHLRADLHQLISIECAKVEGAGRCKVTLASNMMDVAIPDAIKSFSLRIVQEFLQNSLKHSGCTDIEMRLHRNETGLDIRIRDNGKGFDAEDGKAAPYGIGIGNMKKRAAMINADLSLDSAPGEGTGMRLFIPSRYL